MSDKELNIRYESICYNLAERKLKTAFDQIKQLISENSMTVFNDELMGINQTYQYMLQYTVEGSYDPERQNVYRKLIVSAYELADKVRESILLKLSPSIEYEKKRMFTSSYISDLKYFNSKIEEYCSYIGLKSLVDFDAANEINTEEVNHRQQLSQLFYHVWFLDNLTVEVVKFLNDFFVNPSILNEYKSYIISAITLSLQRYFDEEKFKLLFDACENEAAEVNQRALVGLFITLYQYDSRLKYFQEITGRLKIKNEDSDFKQNLERIIKQLIRSKETEKLQRRIHDELIPEMIKISPILKDKIKLDGLMEKGLSDDKNPEWQDLFDNSPGFLNKMEEFSEMQMEGADVFIGSFSMLKSFPFFNEIDNWFIPFFNLNPDINNFVKADDKFISKFVKAIAGAPIMCNSDKYSFCLSIQMLPKENLEMITMSLNEEMANLLDSENTEELTNPGRKAGFISNQYIQDLYRFYKLHPRKNDFEDIFNWSFDFFKKNILGGILKEDLKVLRNIAEYYFSKNYFEEAVEIFEYLLSIEKSGELFQKVAFCYQKNGEYIKALEAYKKAELYELNTLWNHKKIALCYRNLKQPDKALEYYIAAEKLNPDDLNNQFNVGHCLLELDLFEEALKCYFKLEYLDPENKKVWRPIGWCSFLTGKPGQAEKYFMKVLDNDPNKHDLMNMGHVQWSLGNRKSALEYYKKSISETGFTETDFFDVFEEDLPQLVKHGVDVDDVPIMLDQLRYYVNW